MIQKGFWLLALQQVVEVGSVESSGIRVFTLVVHLSIVLIVLNWIERRLCRQTDTTSHFSSPLIEYIEMCMECVQGCVDLHRG